MLIGVSVALQLCPAAVSIGCQVPFDGLQHVWITPPASGTAATAIEPAASAASTATQATSFLEMFMVAPLWGWTERRLPPSRVSRHHPPSEFTRGDLPRAGGAAT